MMLQTISSALLWGAVLNYGVLLIWFLGFSLMHDPLYRLHRRWFALPIERFDANSLRRHGWLQNRHSAVLPGSLACLGAGWMRSFVDMEEIA